MLLITRLQHETQGNVADRGGNFKSDGHCDATSEAGKTKRCGLRPDEVTLYGHHVLRLEVGGG